MNNEQIYVKALDLVSLRRQKAITIFQQQEKNILSKIPKLSVLKNKRIDLGITAAKASLNGVNSPEAILAIKTLKDIDDDIIKLIVENNITEDALEPKFTCKVCNDTGRLSSGEMCQCVHIIAQEIRREELSKCSPLSLCSFENFSLLKYPDEKIGNSSVREHMSGILHYCKAYAEDFGSSSPTLYLHGNSGLGKTHLALSIARVVLSKGYNVLYVSAQAIFDAIEKEHFSFNETGTLASLLSADLLILDDLGTEFLTPYVGSCLYDVINTRWNKHMPTIYTSNFVRIEELSKRYTEKIVSRLMGDCTIMHFNGDDIRLMNK